MRRLAVLLAVGALAGCGGDEERPAASAGPDEPVTSSPSDPTTPAAPAAPANACKRLGRRLVGLRLPAASERAERRGCPLRVAVLDGEPQVLTEDYSPARINVGVRDDVVRRVEFMG
jgi:hypothetical protein